MVAISEQERSTGQCVDILLILLQHRSSNRGRFVDGYGADGAKVEGLAGSGARTSEAEESCVVYGMPRLPRVGAAEFTWRCRIFPGKLWN